MKLITKSTKVRMLQEHERMTIALWRETTTYKLFGVIPVFVHYTNSVLQPQAATISINA